MPHRSDAHASDHMTARARDLRRESTIPERLLWSLLRNRRCGGFKFRRQVPVGPYVVDFLCDQAKVVVELDGQTHVGQGSRDDRRTAHLESRGLRVIRVTNDDVIVDSVVVAEHILRETTARIDALSTDQTRSD